MSAGGRKELNEKDLERINRFSQQAAYARKLQDLEGGAAAEVRDDVRAGGLRPGLSGPPRISF